MSLLLFCCAALFQAQGGKTLTSPVQRTHTGHEARASQDSAFFDGASSGYMGLPAWMDKQRATFRLLDLDSHVHALGRAFVTLCVPCMRLAVRLSLYACMCGMHVG